MHITLPAVGPSAARWCCTSRPTSAQVGHPNDDVGRLPAQPRTLAAGSEASICRGLNGAKRTFHEPHSLARGPELLVPDGEELSIWPLRKA